MSFKRADIDFANIGFQYFKTNANIRYYFKDGKWDKGTLSADDTFPMPIAATCIHYGQAAFEGLKVFETKDGRIVAFRPEENAKRLQSSAKKMFMEPVPTEIFMDALNRVVNANKEFIPPYGSHASLYVRPLLIGMTQQVGVKPAKDYMFLMLVTPVGPYFKNGFQTQKMLVVEDLDRAAEFGLGDVKAAGNYAAGLRGHERAAEQGFTDVLYLDCKNRKYLDESGPANFVGILKDGTYVTPASHSILPSITNMSLRTIAKEDFGWKVEQRPISVDELGNFAEAGCCGTAAVVSPVGEIKYRDTTFKLYDDGKSAGPCIKKLYDELTGIQYGEKADKHNWLYEIKID